MIYDLAQNGGKTRRINYAKKIRTDKKLKDNDFRAKVLNTTAENNKSKKRWNLQQESNSTVAGRFVNTMTSEENEEHPTKNSKRKTLTHSSEGRTLQNYVLRLD